MPYRNSIIIHSWPIAQIGLRSVLQSIGINVRAIFTECPDYKTIEESDYSMILIDVKHEAFIRRHRKLLKKGRC